MCHSVYNWLLSSCSIFSFWFSFRRNWTSALWKHFSERFNRKGAAVASQWTANVSHSNQLATNQASVKLKLINIRGPPFLEWFTFPAFSRTVRKRFTSGGISNQHVLGHSLISTEIGMERSRILVSGFPDGTTESELTVYFQSKRSSGGGDVERIEFDGGQAMVTFEDVKGISLQFVSGSV